MKTNKSVVDHITQTITEDIIQGRLGPGDKLPTENELCEKFQAGRNSIREAIKKLEALGIVYIKRADGTYITDNYVQTMMDPLLYGIILQKNSICNLIDLRSLIEIGTFNIVMQRDDVNQFLPKMYLAYGELSAEMHSLKPDVERVLELDNRFHACIADAAQNPLIATITGYIARLTMPSRRETTKNVIETGEVEHFVDLHRQMIIVLENKAQSEIVKTVNDHYVYWK